ncbi:hypothetical protein [Streptomyces sp. SS]|uniref:hypothetical protein n=1 Tax=Streptomyces sp. SS TaxID=260742 RepID=UPI0002DF8B39|nr:hypothetical protein [Streptomyces sp. SS]
MLTVAVTGTTRAQGGAAARSLLAAGWTADLAAMFAYFTASGLDVDVAALHRDFPEVGRHGFPDWAHAQDRTAILTPGPMPEAARH